MISLNVVLAILFLHWIADFVLQTDEQAKGKSTNNGMLLEHTATYASFWAVPAIYLTTFAGFNHLACAEFIAITFVAHTITDYFTSRLNTYLWKKGDVHNFFVSVGFDQLLHYAQLLLTYKYLIG